jgi:hypothetical protein
MTSPPWITTPTATVVVPLFSSLEEQAHDDKLG